MVKEFLKFLKDIALQYVYGALFMTLVVAFDVAITGNFDIRVLKLVHFAGCLAIALNIPEYIKKYKELFGDEEDSIKVILIVVFLFIIFLFLVYNGCRSIGEVL